MSFSPTTINSNGTVNMTISNLNGVAVDSYLIDINASSSSITRSINATLNILNATFETLNLTSPSNSGTGVALSPTFTWDEILNASSYDIEIATDQQFSSVLFSENISTNSFCFSLNLTSIIFIIQSLIYLYPCRLDLNGCSIRCEI